MAYMPSGSSQHDPYPHLMSSVWRPTSGGCEAAAQTEAHAQVFEDPSRCAANHSSFRGFG